MRIRTADGDFIASYSGAGLCGLTFPRKSKDLPLTGTKPGVARASESSAVPERVRNWHAITIEALQDALAGRPPRSFPPFDLSGGTNFQREVWGVLSRIECGQALSYGEVAKVLGRPGATRAVGSACGANPIPVLIPCHRVLAANGRLGGFSGGLNWKRLLLEREGKDIQT